MMKTHTSNTKQIVLNHKNIKRYNLDHPTDIIKYAYSYSTNTGKCPIRYAHIEITEKCNLKCIMCHADKIIKRNTVMNFTQFKKIIDDIHTLGLKKITIGAIGEPTLNKDLYKMLKYVQEKKINTELITNLSLPLNKELIEAIANLDKLTISIDGATKKTYEKIRVGANYERTISNLKTVASSKKKNQFITINYVIQKDNYFEIPKMIELLDSIGNINKLSTGFAHIIPQKITTRIHLNKKELDEFIKKTIPECEKIKTKQSIITNNNLYKEYWIKQDIHQIQNINPNLIKKIYNMPCYLLWTSTFISPNGNVQPCCSFFANDKFTIGNVKETNFKDIWTSKKYNEFRKKFKKEKHSTCKFCNSIESNKKIDNILKFWKK